MEEICEITLSSFIHPVNGRKSLLVFAAHVSIWVSLTDFDISEFGSWSDGRL